MTDDPALPTANDYLEARRTSREAAIEELSQALGAYSSVQDMVQLPGWGVFVTELQRRAVAERQVVEDTLDSILLGRTPELERAFTESKHRLLVLEDSIQLYLKMRERARDAKNLLDTMPVEGALST